MQNQEQATLLPANKTQEVCLASDAWMYRTAQEDFARDWEEMKSAASYIVPAAFILSAFYFRKDYLETEEFLRQMENSRNFCMINGNRVSLVENPGVAARRKRRKSARVARKRVPPHCSDLGVIEEEDPLTDSESSDS